MKRLVLLFVLLLAVMSLSAVSAADDNLTDAIGDDVAADAALKEVSVENDELIRDAAEDLQKNGDSDEVEKEESQIEASKVKGYESFKTTVSLKLTSDNKPLASKKVTILLNGVNYTKKTDKNGVATLSLKLNKGTYYAKFTYLGDDLTQGAKGKCKVVIKSPVKTKLKLGDKHIIYRQGSKCLFYVKLLTKEGKAVKGQTVKFKVAGKTYRAKTDKAGIAKIFLKLKKGKHKVKYSFKKTCPYLSSSGSHVIKVKAKMAKGNGYWLWPMHMKSISLKNLAKKGTKHIFLHAQAISSYGKSTVVSFINRAHSYGIKVHLWMQVCCVGDKWVSPVNKDGSYKQGFIDGKVKEAKRYAKIPGVDGIHLDYMRFGGTAYKHKNAVDVINYIVKKTSVKVHKVNPNCMLSVALMPEPSSMKYYYGQDVPTLSKYTDALLPMVYKGNYHQTRGWITSVTKAYVTQSSGAQIWTGLQSYHADNNVLKLSQKSLVKDSKAAMKGGAKGVILFRIGISCNFNFKKV